MTLDEAKALLAQIEEARRLVAKDDRDRQAAWCAQECAAGRHEFVTRLVDPRAFIPYCTRCGKEQKR